MSYKLKQYLLFAGISTVIFACVVIIPFIYGLYLTFTSWDGVSRNKPFVGIDNYVNAFADAGYWTSLGRTFIYSAIAVVLVNAVAFIIAYMVTSGIKGQNFCWATMCEECYKHYGIGKLGTGFGQKYEFDKKENAFVKTDG